LASSNLENLPKVVGRTLRQEVVQMVTTAILDGQLQPGDHLPEVELARRLNVSRPIVREAVRDLEADGLVETVPYRGSFVIEIGLEHGRQLYEMARAIEGVVNQLVMPVKDSALRDELMAALEDMEEGQRRGDSRALAVADLRFHDPVYAAARNRYLSDAWRRLRPHLMLLTMRYAETVYDTTDAFVAHHRKVFELLLSGDGAAMAAYVDGRYRVISERFNGLAQHEGGLERA
jgi:DNA-binding GntR family transcriptional regulator